MLRADSYLLQPLQYSSYILVEIEGLLTARLQSGPGVISNGAYAPKTLVLERSQQQYT